MSIIAIVTSTILKPTLSYCPHSNVSEGEHFMPIPFTIVVPFWWPVTPGIMANWRLPSLSAFALIGCFSRKTGSRKKHRY